MLLKRILLITYHFPPSAASGSCRLLGFARHLPTFGWQPLVVAPPTMPWEPIDPRLARDIPEDAIVHAVPYPMAAPRLLRRLAQHAVWLPRAWSACKRMIAEYRPEVILTSGPPHCVHALGHYLKRSTGLPWVADFRDPWISDGSGKKLGWTERWARRWERSVFDNADLVLANAPNACRLFQETYPNASGKIVTLTNGFDPRDSFAYGSASEGAPIRLLHAGEIYARRNPAPLFEALAALNRYASSYRLHLLGRCDAEVLNAPAWRDFVSLEGQRSYQDTLDAMQRADILVLFDSPGRTIGVPAKLYEYLGAGRPVLALAEPTGDTAAILRDSGVLHRIASPNDAAQIRQALRDLAQALHSTAAVGNPAQLQRFTRENITGALARRLDGLVGQPTVTATRIDPLFDRSNRDEVAPSAK